MAPRTGDLSISATGLDFDLVIYVQESCGSSELVLCQDQAWADGATDVVTLPTVQGEVYTIVIDGQGASPETGEYELDLRY